ncbi:MAG: NAD(P)H-hydrate epimerase [Pirellulaceae bacterium]|nr:NAD(P)H-hydrate epimerase [Pirellulaceae bacterium]
MTLPPLTRELVRSIDRKAIEDYGMSGLVLMENAGRGCADKLCELGIRGKVVIVCGKGNNGGDGFVITRHLDARGIRVRVVLVAQPDELRGDAEANYAVLKSAGFPIVDVSGLSDALAGADWIVDALLGTGATGDPRQPIARAIEMLTASGSRKLAVDLPSGLDCDTGIPGYPTFRADQTCTFVAPKVGFANPAAKEFLGTVSVHDIGVPRKLLEEFMRQE